MNIVVTTQEKLESIIDSSVNRAVKDFYRQKDAEIKKSKFFTILEASNELKVSILTIRNYIEKGFLKADKIGNRVLISYESIENALSEVKSLRYKRDCKSSKNN